MKKIINYFLNVIFPRECLGCAKNDYLVCDECLSKIEDYSGEKVIPDIVDKVLICSSYKNSLIKKIVHFYKYKYISDLCFPLSKLMIKKYESEKDKILDPIVVCAPLSKKRFNLRCYNQAELLAKEFSGNFNYKFLPDLIIKTRHTKQQAKLNREERLINLKDSFAVSDCEICKNNNFIIIDDIYTTGATVNEIAKVLKDNGAKEIWALVIAKD
ncbi:MAG TPA: phosphoribosyltransferase family protein [bacterium]|nr:phosphoribosyltransferase family protein [bacterium]